jgi:hypothetical protein
MPNNLDGYAVLITGGSTGLGLSHARIRYADDPRRHDAEIFEAIIASMALKRQVLPQEVSYAIACSPTAKPMP